MNKSEKAIEKVSPCKVFDKISYVLGAKTKKKE